MKGLKAPSVLPIPIGGSSKEFTNWLFLREAASHALNDVGLTSRPIAYWVGEAMGSTNFVDLAKVPKLARKAIFGRGQLRPRCSGVLKFSYYSIACPKRQQNSCQARHLALSYTTRLID
ncbi:UNVERIFIED_ORG: hypothetical protein GGE64_001522 [Rhizobium etli]|uniref:hypothetical protein n=1 Tax=Rhizobium sophoriradicis TaxID=1535245 RepID=UPI00185A596E